MLLNVLTVFNALLFKKEGLTKPDCEGRNSRSLHSACRRARSLRRPFRTRLRFASSLTTNINVLFQTTSERVPLISWRWCRSGREEGGTFPHRNAFLTKFTRFTGYNLLYEKNPGRLVLSKMLPCRGIPPFSQPFVHSGQSHFMNDHSLRPMQEFQDISGENFLAIFVRNIHGIDTGSGIHCECTSTGGIHWRIRSIQHSVGSKEIVRHLKQ